MRRVSLFRYYFSSMHRIASAKPQKYLIYLQTPKWNNMHTCSFTTHTNYVTYSVGVWRIKYKIYDHYLFEKNDTQQKLKHILESMIPNFICEELRHDDTILHKITVELRKQLGDYGIDILELTI